MQNMICPSVYAGDDNHGASRTNFSTADSRVRWKHTQGRGSVHARAGQQGTVPCSLDVNAKECSVSDMKETEIRKDRLECWLPLFSHYFIPTLPLSFFCPPHVAFDHPWPWLFAFFWAKTDAGEEPWILQGLSWVVIIYNNIIDGHNRKLSRCVVSSAVWGI